MRLIAIMLMVLLAGPALADKAVPQSQTQITLSFAPVVKAAAPAVVNVYARQIVRDQGSPFASDPFFGQFLRDLGPSRPQVQNSLGSGVILSPDGLVVSNYHVVGGADEIRVVLADRREFEAEVVLADEEADLAVLRLKGARGLPVLALRDSDEVEVGDLVLAIGNPFGIGQTVSSGIISGLARSGLSVGGGRGYFLQTDAAINPGNSGGALVDMQGRLVGINSAILTQSGGSNGVGFAIPANLVRSFLDQAQAGATRFQRPWAGLSGQAVDASMAEGLGLDRPTGLVISDINAASPFGRAGLQVGDVVLRLGGEEVNSPQEMLFRMATMRIGTTATVDILRRGRPMSLKVTLVAPPETPAREPLTIGGNSVFRGLSVERINPAVIAELGLPQSAEGVVVTAADDLAAQIGFQTGDIVVAVNGRGIDRPRDLQAAGDDRSRSWRVELVRQGKRLQLRFRI